MQIKLYYPSGETEIVEVDRFTVLNEEDAAWEKVKLLKETLNKIEEGITELENRVNKLLEERK